MKSSSSKWSESGPSLNRTTTSSTSTEFLTTKTSNHGSLPPGLVSSSRKGRRSHVNSSSHKQFSSGSTLASTANNHSGYPTLSMSSGAPGVGMHMPIWSNMPHNMLEPPIYSSTFMNGKGFPPTVQHSADNHRGVTSARVDQRNVDEIQHEFVAFKKFDTVEDYSDHHFAKHASSAKLVSESYGGFRSPLSLLLISGLVLCVCCSLLLIILCSSSVIALISSGTGTEELGQENTRRMEDTGKRLTRLNSNTIMHQFFYCRSFFNC